MLAARGPLLAAMGPLLVAWNVRGTYYSAVGNVGWDVLLASLPYGEPLGIHTLPVHI